MGQLEYGGIQVTHWYQWSDLAFHWYTIGEMHLIKGTYSIFLTDQVEYGAILFVHWYQWYDWYQWSDLAFHWDTIGEMHLIKGT